MLISRAHLLLLFHGGLLLASALLHRLHSFHCLLRHGVGLGFGALKRKFVKSSDKNKKKQNKQLIMKTANPNFKKKDLMTEQVGLYHNVQQK